MVNYISLMFKLCMNIIKNAFFLTCLKEFMRLSIPITRLKMRKHIRSKSSTVKAMEKI